MGKCNACGKFLSSADSTKCSKCPVVYHRVCVTTPESVNSKGVASWLCPNCKIKTPNTSASLTSTNLANQSSGTQIISDETGVDLLRELRLFRDDIGALKGEVRQCRLEIADLKTTLLSYGERLDNMEGRISALERKSNEKVPDNIQHLESTIADLKNEMNDRDQNYLLSDVVITGVPETREESLGHILGLIGVKLGSELDERDIVFVERTGLPRRNRVSQDVAEEAAQRPRNIVVRLARRAARDQLLRAARVRRHLTTADLHMSGTSHRIYLNERLTHTNHKLFHRAREEGRRLQWKYIWTRDGKIFTRKEDGKQAERIRSAKDLDRVFGLGTV